MLLRADYTPRSSVRALETPLGYNAGDMINLEMLMVMINRLKNARHG